MIDVELESYIHSATCRLMHNPPHGFAVYFEYWLILSSDSQFFKAKDLTAEGALVNQRILSLRSWGFPCSISCFALLDNILKNFIV
jgi:hypothetical protein